MKMSNKVKTSLGAFATVASGVIMALPAAAGSVGGGNVKTYLSEQSATGRENGELTGTVNVVINVAIGIIGLLAVIMIIVGGFQYTTSAGDSGKVTKAKNSILYGVIGLVIALLAFAIVNFVLKNVFGIN